MNLVDTSVWIDFIRGRQQWAYLAESIRDGFVLVHPWVVGEVSLGHLGRKRDDILADLHQLPAAPVVPPDELLGFIEHHSLAGAGIGLVDAQLMASARVAGAALLTGDRRLAQVWQRLESSRRA